MLLAAGLSFLPGKLAHLLLGVTELSLESLVLFLLTVLSGSALVPFLSQLLHVFLEPIGQALGEQVEKEEQQAGCQPGRGAVGGKSGQALWSHYLVMAKRCGSSLLPSPHPYPILSCVFLCVGTRV